MKPVNIGGHAAYQKHVLEQLRKYYPNALTSFDAGSLFPLLGLASRHDSHGFWYNFFSVKQFLPEANITKLLLDSAHDAMAYYQYCSEHGIKPFIDLNGKGGRPLFARTTSRS